MKKVTHSATVYDMYGNGVLFNVTVSIDGSDAIVNGVPVAIVCPEIIDDEIVGFSIAGGARVTL